MSVKHVGSIWLPRSLAIRLLALPLTAFSVGTVQPCLADGLTPQQLQSLLATGNASTSSVTDTIARQIAASASNLATTAVQASGGDVSRTMLTATGATTARMEADRAADVINVMDFGAKGDDATDDTAAINAALNAARAKTLGLSEAYVSTTGPYARILFPGGHRFRQNGTLNFTGFSRGLIVDMGGAALDCHAAADTCIDALDSSAITWNNLTLTGDATDMPKTGLQMGRSEYSSAGVTQAAHVLFNDAMIAGQFSFSAFYNFAGEILTMFHPSIQNFSGLTGSYAVVEDGYNHFGLTSHFQTVTAPANTWASFNENLWIEGDIHANVGNGIPFWVGGASRLKFVNTYAAGGSPTCTTCYGMVLYNTGGQNTVLLHADINFETTYMTDAFFFTGDNTLSMNGLFFRDPEAGAINSLFKMDSNMTQIQLTHAEIHIDSYQAGAKLFDKPANWRLFGEYSAGSITGWTPPAYGQVLLNIGGQEQLASYGGAPIASQVADSTTVGGNTRGNYAVDLQSLRNSATQAGTGLYSTIPGGAYNTAAGEGALAAGEGSAASGRISVALGQSVALGSGSLAAGLASRASGVNSTVLGGQGDDHGNTGTLAVSAAQFTTGGDAQAGRHILSGAGTGTSSIRLTAGAGAAAPASCLAVPANFSYGLTIHLHAADFTNRGTDYDWVLPQAMLTQAATLASTSYKQGPTAPTVLSTGTVTGAAVAVSADTTNGCLNLAFTPPSANTTDTWHAVAVIDTVEMQ